MFLHIRTKIMVIIVPPKLPTAIHASKKQSEVESEGVAD